jgi:hypothetical protein
MAVHNMTSKPMLLAMMHHSYIVNILLGRCFDSILKYLNCELVSFHLDLEIRGFSRTMCRRHYL